MGGWTELVVWWADYYALAGALLALALAVQGGLRQPARRLAVARATLGGLAALALLTAMPDWPRRSVLPETTWQSGASSAWLAGVLLCGSATTIVWLVVGAWRTRRLRRTARPAPGALVELLRHVADRSTLPRLLLSRWIGQPMAFGAWRPTIVLPEPEPDTTAQHLETVLAHECAHVRHGDLRLLFVSRLLLVVLFAHPLYWWLRRRLRADQETLADAAAAAHGGPVEYAAALLHWAKRPHRSTDASLSLGAQPTRCRRRPSPLKQRIAQLLDPHFAVETRCPRRCRTAAVLLTGLLVCALSAVTLRPPVPGVVEPAAVVIPTALAQETPVNVDRVKVGVVVVVTVAPFPRPPEQGRAEKDIHQLSMQVDSLAQWWHKHSAEWLYRILVWWMTERF